MLFIKMKNDKEVSMKCEFCDKDFIKTDEQGDTIKECFWYCNNDECYNLQTKKNKKMFYKKSCKWAEDKEYACCCKCGSNNNIIEGCPIGECRKVWEAFNVLKTIGN